MELDTNPRQLVSEIKARWRQEGAPDAVRCFANHPAIRNQKSLALELAYEEYCLREEAGDSVNIPAFCERFPAICHSLQRQLEVHKYFKSNPDVMDSAATLPWPVPGEMFLGFRIIEELGRGGLARVFLCSQPTVGDRQVVIKVAHQGAYEADTLGRLKHPNIVPVYAVVEDDQTGMSGISMPFCGRSTLCDVLDQAFAETAQPSRAQVIIEAAIQHADEQDRYDRVEAADRRMVSASYVNGVLHLGTQLAEALCHAHDQNILHGDLKPSNVLITPSGRPMLLDFNLSHDQQHPATMTGGTLPYMAPEQVRNTVLKSEKEEDRVDQRSDVYSLGTILYELLCGQLPYGPVLEPIATIDLARKRLAAQQLGHTSLAKRVRTVDPSLALFIDQCLAYDRAARPDSMAEVAARLSRHRNLSRRAARWTRVNRRVVLASAGALVLAGGFSALFAVSQQPYPIRELERGLDCYRTGQYDDAITHFSNATRDDPAFAEAHYHCGRAEIKLGELARSRRSDQATRHFEQARHAFSKSADLRGEGRDFACRAYCFNNIPEQWRWAQAIRDYKKALEEGFESAGLYNNLGYCKEKTLLPDEARSRFEDAVASDPTCRVAYYNLARLDLQRANSEHRDGNKRYVPEMGIDAIEKVIGLSSDSDTYVYMVAAQLFGYAANAHPSYDDKCLASLRSALVDGRRSAWNLAKSPALESVRTRHPQVFQEILSIPETSIPFVPFPHLLDPINETSAEF